MFSILKRFKSCKKIVLAPFIFLFVLCCLPCTAQNNREVAMTVEELFQHLDANNSSLRSQQAGVEVAEHDIATAKSKRLPDVGVSLSAAYNGNVVMTDRDFSNATAFSSPHFSNSFSLQAEQTVYAGGAIDAGIRLAELKRQQAETSLSLTRTQQRFLVLGLYLDLYKADNSIKVYESNIALTEQLIDDIKEKLVQGMALRNDVTRYELQMESLKLGLRKVQDERAVLNYQLCNAIGMEKVTILPDRNITAMPMSDDGEAFWHERASLSSPLLRQSMLGVEVAEENLRIAKSDMMPKVSVFAADNFSGPYTYDIPPIDNNFNIWYVGVGVRYSLSSLFKSNKGVRRARAAVTQSKDQREATVEVVDNNIQQAYTLYRQSYVELQTQQKNVQLAAQNYQVMNDRYMAQLALVTDMIDASVVKLDAELKEIDARINIVFAWYRMKYAAGEI